MRSFREIEYTPSLVPDAWREPPVAAVRNTLRFGRISSLVLHTRDCIEEAQMDVHIELERARRENQLLDRLLALADATDVGALLTEALPIIMDAAGATIGYLEIHDLSAASAEPGW